MAKKKDGGVPMDILEFLKVLEARLVAEQVPADAIRRLVTLVASDAIDYAAAFTADVLHPAEEKKGGRVRG